MNKTPMTVRKASEYTGISRQHLYTLIRKKKIPYYKLGDSEKARVMFAKEELDDFIFCHRIPTEAELQENSFKAMAR